MRKDRQHRANHQNCEKDSKSQILNLRLYSLPNQKEKRHFKTEPLKLESIISDYQVDKYQRSFQDMT